jgi:hypothetical protein
MLTHDRKFHNALGATESVAGLGLFLPAYLGPSRQETSLSLRPMRHGTIVATMSGMKTARSAGKARGSRLCAIPEHTQRNRSHAQAFGFNRPNSGNVFDVRSNRRASGFYGTRKRRV